MADAEGLIRLEARLKRDAHLLVLVLVVAIFVMLIDFQIKWAIQRTARELSVLLARQEGVNFSEPSAAKPAPAAPRGGSVAGWNGGRDLDGAARVETPASRAGGAAQAGVPGSPDGPPVGAPGDERGAGGGQPGNSSVEVSGD